MSLTLGIDIGTSGVRTAVVDEDGAVISMARADHPPQPGIGIDARLWLQAVETCVAAQVEALHSLGRDAKAIASIAVDGTSGSMVLTDADLHPVSPALMYNSKGFDSEALAIADLAPDPHIARGSNSALGRAMRLMSLAKAEPAHLMHQADYVASKLTGIGGVSDHNNALKTGYDPQAEAWPDWIGRVISPDLLPDVKAVGTPIGQIDQDVALSLGLSETAVVVAGTTDSIAAFLASAPLKPGVAVTSLGSTLAVKLLSTTRLDDPAIGLYAHRIRDFWLVGGASNTGGAVLAHFFSSKQMSELSEKIDPEQSTGLDYYPLLQPGERFPVNDPAFPGNLAPRPQEDHLFLAGLLEGIATIEARCYREIEARGGGYPSVVYSAGGGAKNPRYTRIRARALDTDVRTGAESEAAVGAAKVARMGIAS